MLSWMAIVMMSSLQSSHIRRRPELVIFAAGILLSLCVQVTGQQPPFDSGEDCVDWFLVNWSNIEKSSAVVGRAEISDDQGLGYSELHWFEIRCFDKATQRPLRYYEISNQSATSDQSDPGTTYFRSLTGLEKSRFKYGRFDQPLEEVAPPKFDKDGKLISGYQPNDFPPNAFTMGLVTCSAIRMCDEFDHRYFSKLFSSTEFVDLRDEKGLKLVTLFNDKICKEIHSDEVSGMPVKVRGFFRNDSRNQKAARSSFSTLNFESKIGWECLDKEKGLFAPTFVDNIVHRVNPKKKVSMHLQMNTAYAVVPSNSDLLSEENRSSYLFKSGPIEQLKTNLIDRLKRNRMVQTKGEN